MSDDETVTQRFTYDLAGQLIYEWRSSTVSALTITTTSDTTRYVYSGADPAMLAELRGVVGPLLPRGGNWRRILCEGRAYQALEGLEVGFEGLAAGG